MGPSVDTGIINEEVEEIDETEVSHPRGGTGVITVAKPNTGTDSDDHMLVNLPVTVEVRQCVKNFDKDGNTGVYTKPMTYDLAVKLWWDAEMVLQDNLEILPRSVTKTEYNIITGDASSYYGSWLCAVKFANALTDTIMGEEERAYVDGKLGMAENTPIMAPQLISSKKGWRLPFYEETNKTYEDEEEWLGYSAYLTRQGIVNDARGVNPSKHIEADMVVAYTTVNYTYNSTDDRNKYGHYGFLLLWYGMHDRTIGTPREVSGWPCQGAHVVDRNMRVYSYPSNSYVRHLGCFWNIRIHKQHMGNGDECNYAYEGFDEILKRVWGKGETVNITEPLYTPRSQIPFRVCRPAP